MGTLFLYLSDTTLSECKVELCPSCGKEDTVFPVDATPKDHEWTVQSEEVEVLCYRCIRSIPLRKLSPRDPEEKLQHHIDQHYKKGTLSRIQRLRKFVGLCDELRRTPRIPLFLQWEDWPFCCGDYCEYQGFPTTYEESMRVGTEIPHWEFGPKDFREIYGDTTLEPECLDEVCIFKCLKCKKEFFTWQYT